MNDTNVPPQDFYELDQGGITKIDFSKLYSLQLQGAKPDGGSSDHIQLLTRRTKQRDLPVFLQRMLPRLSQSSLSLTRRLPAPPVKLQPLPSQGSFAVSDTREREQDSQITIEIPYGLPQYVNAATLKTMLRAGRRDVLFRKVGKRWEVCSQSHRINLSDRTEVYRLGQIQIIS